MNRRTEFRILSKDYVPRDIINEGGTVNIAINPAEDNDVTFTLDKRGYFTFLAHVDGYKEIFTYSQNANFCISETTALRLLKEGRISRDNFEGDVTKILGTGTVANGATLIIKEIRIANKTLSNVKVKVMQKMVEDWVIGKKTLGEMGNFEFDTKERNLIFK